MSLRNAGQDLEYTQMLGMDTTSPVSALASSPGWLVDARNFDLGLEGGVVKRSGYANQLSTPYGSKDISFGIEYTDVNASRKTIVFATDYTGSGGSLGYVSAGAGVDIRTGITGTVRPGIIQFRDLLFFYNGVDAPFLYNGSVTKQVGITAPSTAPTVGAQSTGGSLTQNGTYIWAYTYYNSSTKAESSPSPGSGSTTLTGTNTQVALTLVAGSSTTADTIRVWRTAANGGQLFLEGTTGIATTSYTSSVSDAALTTGMELDNTQISILSSTAKYPTIARNRVFLVTGTNEVRWSKIGQSGPMPESFQVTGFADTVGKRGSNDPIIGLNSANDIPIVLKSNSMGRLDEIYFPSQQSPTDPVYYVYTEMSDKVGAVSHWASVQVKGELLWLSRDNIYATDGQQIRPVGDSIQATIRSAGFSASQVTKVTAHNDTKFKRVYFSIFLSGTSTKPQYVLVGDYHKYPNFRWTWYTPGTNQNTHPGVTAASFFSVTNTTDGSQDTWFGSANTDGKAYLMNSTDSDDGSAIFGKLVSRPYAIEQPMSWKIFSNASIHVQGSGAIYNLTVAAIYDLSTNEETSTPFALATNTSVYDTALYDTATYSDVAVSIKRYNAHRKARFQQFVFYQIDANAPVSIFGWGTSASIFKLF